MARDPVSPHEPARERQQPNLLLLAGITVLSLMITVAVLALTLL